MIDEFREFVRRSGSESLLWTAVSALRTLTQGWRARAKHTAGSCDRAALAFRVGADEVDAALEVYFLDILLAVERVTLPLLRAGDHASLEVVRPLLRPTIDPRPAEADSPPVMQPATMARLGLLLIICAELGAAWEEHAAIIHEVDPCGAEALNDVAAALADLPRHFADIDLPSPAQISADLQDSDHTKSAHQTMQVHTIVADLKALAERT